MSIQKLSVRNKDLYYLYSLRFLMWRDIKVIDTVLLGNADEVLMDPRMQRRHSVILHSIDHVGHEKRFA